MVDDTLLRFLLTYRATLFSCPITEDNIRRKTCFTCLDITEDAMQTTCEKCTYDISIIKTWCNPRGRCYQHPEALITNQQQPHPFVIRPWNTCNRNPVKLHPNANFSQSIYDGYLDSLLISLLLQMHNILIFTPFTEVERHPFDITFWKHSLPGIESLLQLMSSSIRYPETLSVLTNTNYTLLGVNEKSILYYGKNLWSKHLIPKLFNNYRDIKNKFLELLQVTDDTRSNSPTQQQAIALHTVPQQQQANGTLQAHAQANGSLLSPPPQQLQHQPQPNATIATPTQAPVCDLLKTFEGVPSPGSLFNYLTNDSVTPEHTTRKHYVKNICSNMNLHTSNDIISALVEQKSHIFKSIKIQKLFDSYNFQAETLNLTMFSMLMAALTPEDITDMNAIYDHIGNYMIIKK